jgi:hypothetical protein
MGKEGASVTKEVRVLTGQQSQDVCMYIIYNKDTSAKSTFFS